MHRYTCCVRPYYRESTWTRLISEVKPCQAALVLGWATTWEPAVLYTFYQHLEKETNNNFILWGDRGGGHLADTWAASCRRLFCTARAGGRWRWCNPAGVHNNHTHARPHTTWRTDDIAAATDLILLSSFLHFAAAVCHPSIHPQKLVVWCGVVCVTRGFRSYRL